MAALGSLLLAAGAVLALFSTGRSVEGASPLEKLFFFRPNSPLKNAS
jgi:hypothetical protein